MSLKATRIVALILLVLSGSAYYFAQQVGLAQQGGLTPPPKPSDGKTAATPTNEGSPFVVGERLTYNVTWSRFVTAARIEMEIVERGAFFNQEGYQLRTKVETNSEVRSIFELYNQYTSYIGAKTMQPYRLENSTRQGSRTSDESVVLDQAQKEIRFNDQSMMPLPNDTYDLPTLLYVLRQRPLTDGASHNFNVYFGKQIYEVEAEVKKRERVTTQLGAYNAIRVDISPKGKSKYRTRVWFSDDAQHLPVGIQTQMPFGDVRAELTYVTVASRAARSPIATPTPTEDGKPLNVAASNGTPRPLPFDLGERLNYDIAWGNFTAVGKASFEVRQKGPSEDGTRQMIEFAGEAASVGAARSLMIVNDQLISFVDAKTLEPLKTETRLREGRRTKEVTCDYDLKERIATLTNTTKITLPPNTLDLLSLFYNVRAEPLRIGDFYRYAFLDANHRLHGVTVKVAKQEIIGGPLGSRETVQLDILTPNQSQLVAQAWITNDARHLPLYFATRTRFGELRFQLMSVVNPR
jgi:hypothetical protein